MTFLGLLIALGGVASAQDAQHHVDQAKLFVKKQWYTDAEAELEEAVTLDDGRNSFQAWWLLAQVRYELLDAEGAAKAARQASELTRDPDEALQAAQLADWIEGTFGLLVITSPHEGMQSRIQLERSSLLMDPDLKRFVDQMALEWTKPQVLPIRIALPAGEYLVQGERVLLEPGLGVETALDLSMGSLGESGFAALQVTRAEVSTGVGLYLGDRTAPLGPSLEVQLGVTQPIKGILAGVVVDYSLRSYNVDGFGAVRHPATYTLGVRLGKELMVSGPLAVRPGLGYRYGYLPGIPFECIDEASGVACAPPDELDRDPDIMVYAVGRAHIPFAELSVDWRRAGRTTATGLGVRVVVDQAFGFVPSPGTATVSGDGTTIEYTTADPAWTSTAIRMMANFSHAF
ncbi:MAG: tetratricopeptide repeat protein [Proteobacteria bacterium]|nr:tetratricopeptide repeat protein [Pseudomonadota bacterium]MCP4921596.1 tetratricopeptide repeat protein [Pseudomonadota bacterium]